MHGRHDGHPCKKVIHLKRGTHRADGYELVGVVHHGDEEVEEDDDVDDGEGAEHEEAGEARELLDAGQLEVVQVDQAEDGPEQGLGGLPQAVCRYGFVYTGLHRPYCTFH